VRERGRESQIGKREEEMCVCKGEREMEKERVRKKLLLFVNSDCCVRT